MREDDKKEIQRSGDLSRAYDIDTKEIDQSPEEIDKRDIDRAEEIDMKGDWSKDGIDCDVVRFIKDQKRLHEGEIDQRAEESEMNRRVGRLKKYRGDRYRET